jgi:hypothetical protein
VGKSFVVDRNAMLAQGSNGPFQINGVPKDDGGDDQVETKWHFRIFNLSVVHLSNRYMPRPVRVFKEFAGLMAPILFPKLPA